MKIKPLQGIVQLKIERPQAGDLDVSSRDTAVEFAEVVAVVAVGETQATTPQIIKGDKVFVKSWAVDIINHNGQTYYFVSLESKGILAVVK